MSNKMWYGRVCQGGITPELMNGKPSASTFLLLLSGLPNSKRFLVEDLWVLFAWDLVLTVRLRGGLDVVLRLVDSGDGY